MALRKEVGGCFLIVYCRLNILIEGIVQGHCFWHITHWTIGVVCDYCSICQLDFVIAAQFRLDPHIVQSSTFKFVVLHPLNCIVLC